MSERQKEKEKEKVGGVKRKRRRKKLDEKESRLIKKKFSCKWESVPSPQVTTHSTS